MSFLTPWVAATIAAVVVPALLILYFLKLRRREERIASTLLWKRAIKDLQVNAPFQRLRRNLLLLLQLLVIAAVVLALARPIVETTVAAEDRVVLLIDRSASMNAREGEQTRLDEAKEQAIRLVRTLNQRARGWRSFFRFEPAEAGTQVLVIAFAEHASIVSPFTTNTSELVDLIEKIEPTDGRTDMREALELAEAYMAPPTRLTPGMEDTPQVTPQSAEVPAKLVLISDGRVANLDQLVLRSGTMELVRIGSARDNVGITNFRHQRNYERPELLSLFLTVQNFGPDPVQADVSVQVDGVLAGVRPIELAGCTASADGAEAPADAGSSASLSFDIPLDRAAVVEARLSRDDVFAVDNVAYTIAPPPRRMSVLTVTRRNLFLDSALRPLPLAEYPFVTPEEYETQRSRFVTDNRSNYDVVIFDKVAPNTLPGGSFFFIGAVPPLEGISRHDEKLEWLVPIWWDESHPLLRHVSLSGLFVYEGFAVDLPEQAEVLIEGSHGPMLARYAAGDKHCLLLTFAVERSNWWSSSFPAFMYNVVRYLGGGGAEAEEGPLRPGDTLQVPAPAGRDELRLVRPDGRTVKLRPDAMGSAYYGHTDDVGVYRVEDGVAGRDTFAVNLEDSWESGIAPPTAPLKIDTHEVVEVGAITTATPEVWRWFVGVALALVLIEWWIYNRRVMI